MVYPRILNIVLCAIQKNLVVYLHLSLKKTKNTTWTIPSTFPFQKHIPDIGTEAGGANPLLLKSDPLPDARDLHFPPAQSEARALGLIPILQPGPYPYTPVTLKAWSCTSGFGITWNSVRNTSSQVSLFQCTVKSESLLQVSDFSCAQWEKKQPRVILLTRILSNTDFKI